MNRENIKKAIFEATRFVDRATELMKAMDSEETKQWGGCNPKESGACRRQSMELTRALAAMRRP